LVGADVGFALGTLLGRTVVGIAVGFDVGVGFALGELVGGSVNS